MTTQVEAEMYQTKRLKAMGKNVVNNRLQQEPTKFTEAQMEASKSRRKKK